ncbi:unnamed protein product, partial [Rotaria sordida]
MEHAIQARSSVSTTQ